MGKSYIFRCCFCSGLFANAKSKDCHEKSHLNYFFKNSHRYIFKWEIKDNKSVCYLHDKKPTQKEQIFYKCAKCYRSFMLKHNLERHTLQCQGKKKGHECVVCLKAFARLKNLEQHEKTIHPFLL